jgi:prepilin-type processing-associated H-X9-DG protein
MSRINRAFTLTELVVAVPVVGLLAGTLLVSTSGVRKNDNTTVCLKRQGDFVTGWAMYARENKGNMVPGRMFDKPGGKTEPANWYDVGNGLKYRPRWAATIGAHTGVYAFKKPSKSDDRQDYVPAAYQCPQASDWIDERNYGLGYNYQFLGNARQTNNQFRNFPIKLKRIAETDGTVVFADAMGTAADFAASARADYSNDGRREENMGNHGWSLDPPRLTDRCDRGTGEPGSPRTAVDPRHNSKVNVVFVDGHGASMTAQQLGYRIDKRGRFVNVGIRPDGTQDFAHNRFFSGIGRDDHPPDLPGDAG